MTKLYLFIINLLKHVVVLLSASIVVVVTVQVFSRFVLQSPSSVTEELARFLLIWIGLLGGAYGYHSSAHLGLDILTNRFSELGQRVVGIIGHVLVMIFAISVMVIGGISLVSLTFEPTQISAALEFKMGYIYSAVPLSGALIVYIALMKISDLMSQIINNKEVA